MPRRRASRFGDRRTKRVRVDFSAFARPRGVGVRPLTEAMQHLSRLTWDRQGRWERPTFAAALHRVDIRGAPQRRRLLRDVPQGPHGRPLRWARHLGQDGACERPDITRFRDRHHLLGLSRASRLGYRASDPDLDGTARVPVHSHGAGERPHALPALSSVRRRAGLVGEFGHVRAVGACIICRDRGGGGRVAHSQRRYGRDIAPCGRVSELPCAHG